MGGPRPQPTLSHPSTAIVGGVNKAGVDARVTQSADQKTTTQPSIKKAPEKRVRGVGRARSRVPGYATVLGALGRDDVRERVLSRFKDRGGDRNRWNASDHGVMADALTRAEDWLELDHPRWPERDALAVVRRKVEAGLV